MYWLFNKGKFTLKGTEKESISWKQAGNFKGKIGDKIIFYSFEKGKEIFTHVYTIRSEKSEPAGKNERGKELRNIQVELDLQNKYEGIKEFGDYLYSIPRIKYFDKKLYLHFNRKYYRLSETEFNAIDKDEIFESRTILGSGLNAMHVDHRKTFIIYLVDRYPEVTQNNYDYEKILILFYKYLDFAILKPAKQLREAYSDIQKIAEPEIASILAFSNEEGSNDFEMIGAQANIIAEYLGSYQEAISLAGNGQKSSKDRSFHKLFRNRSLPIDFNN